MIRRKGFYTQTELNSLGYLSSASRNQVVIPTGTADMNALGYQPDRFVREEAGRFDGDTQLGKWSIKKPLGGKKSILRTVGKVVTKPISLIAAPALQAVGLKTLANSVNDGVWSKDNLKKAGTVIDIAGAVVGAVVLAPIVAGAAGSAGSAVAGAVSSAGSAVGVTGASLVGKAGPLVNKVLGSLKKDNKAPAYAELSAEEQSSVNQAEYEQIIKDQIAVIQKLEADNQQAKLPSSVTATGATETNLTPTGLTGGTYTANPPANYPASQPPASGSPSSVSVNVPGAQTDGSRNLRDAVADRPAGLIPEAFKPYLPYAIGGLSLLILAAIMVPRRAAPVFASNPYRRNR